MSIYIKGMEMPETCYYCPFSLVGNDWVTPSCILVGEDMERYEYKHKRMDGCPLIEAPPHGRLIDADALMAKVEHDTPLSDVYEKTMRRYLNNAPTIIEAEEGEG